MAHSTRCHCPFDIIPPFTDSFCCLLCPFPLTIVALSSSWTHLVKLTLFINRSCPVSGWIRLISAGRALVCSYNGLAPSDQPSSFVQASHSHFENKTRFSDNPEKFPGCYYSKPRALQFSFLRQFKEQEGEINQPSLFWGQLWLFVLVWHWSTGHSIALCICLSFGLTPPAPPPPMSLSVGIQCIFSNC